MGPILMVSFFMWLLIINRIFFLRRLHVRNIPRKPGRGKWSKNNQVPPGQLPGSQLPSGPGVLSPSVAGIRYWMTIFWMKLSYAWSPPLDAYLAAIRVLAAVAPLLGLLGTVERV